MIRQKLGLSSIRLNKFLAQIGIASRRAIDEFIIQGRISINGKVSKQLGIKIDPQRDQIMIDNRKIDNASEKLIYIILNKPKGVISTAKDNFGNTTVLDLVKTNARLYPVGRLDQDSHGIILLTNDGSLTYKLTHPKYHIAKIYRVTILGFANDINIKKLSQGVLLDDGKTAPAVVKIINRNERQTILEITLYEGKKRQIRRMCSTLHLHLTDLQRIAIGPIQLGSLGIGKWRNLSQKEINYLKR